MRPKGWVRALHWRTARCHANPASFLCCEPWTTTRSSSFGSSRRSVTREVDAPVRRHRHRGVARVRCRVDDQLVLPVLQSLVEAGRSLAPRTNLWAPSDCYAQARHPHHSIARAPHSAGLPAPPQPPQPTAPPPPPSPPPPSSAFMTVCHHHSVSSCHSAGSLVLL